MNTQENSFELPETYSDIIALAPNSKARQAEIEMILKKPGPKPAKLQKIRRVLNPVDPEDFVQSQRLDELDRIVAIGSRNFEEQQRQRREQQRRRKRRHDDSITSSENSLPLPLNVSEHSIPNLNVTPNPVLTQGSPVANPPPRIAQQLASSQSSEDSEDQEPPPRRDEQVVPPSQTHRNTRTSNEGSAHTNMGAPSRPHIPYVPSTGARGAATRNSKDIHGA